MKLKVCKHMQAKAEDLLTETVISHLLFLEAASNCLLVWSLIQNPVFEGNKNPLKCLGMF